ncbi:MAG: hypothetical protein IT518_02060 [Burkholderiales bacterium]|nr:hypothetical protein [Burkholderiales bacterium]
MGRPLLSHFEKRPRRLSAADAGARRTGARRARKLSAAGAPAVNDDATMAQRDCVRQ